MVKFSGEDHARQWLTTQPRDVQVALAARCSLRALPGIASQDRRSLEVLVFPVLRAILTSVAAVASTNPTIRQAADAAARRAHYTRNAANLSETGIARDAAYAAFSAAHAAYSPPKSARPISTSATRAVTHSVGAVGKAVGQFTTGAHPQNPKEAGFFFSFENSSRDATQLENNPPVSVFECSLWNHDVNLIEGLAVGISRLNRYWRENSDHWDFWKDWYEGLLQGQPLDWNLQEAVALIPEEDWEKGAAHIAEKIREIEARFELKRELDYAEKEITRSHAQRLGIGGNNPPESIDELPEMTQELTILWQPIGELKEEVQANEPSPVRIESAISKLIGILKSCGKWIGGKLDAAASEYAKAIGKWGGTATTFWIATQVPQIEAVLIAAQNWLLSLLL